MRRSSKQVRAVVMVAGGTIVMAAAPLARAEQFTLFEGGQSSGCALGAGGGSGGTALALGGLALGALVMFRRRRH